jgi:hypothetical protein
MTMVCEDHDPQRNHPHTENAYELPVPLSEVVLVVCLAAGSVVVVVVVS